MPALCLCYTSHCLLRLLESAFRTCFVALFYSCVVQSHCFSITSFHHSLMSCFVLLCSVFPPPPSPASCLGCLYLGPFFVFSCACPSPSRSEHRGAHSNPSGRETTEDQPPAQAGGRQRYKSVRNKMAQCLGKGLCVFGLIPFILET